MLNLATTDSIGLGAPELQILQEDGLTYTRYYYTDDAEDEGGNYVTGWADEYDYLAADEYPIGTGYWYWSRGSKSHISLPGQVNGDASVSKDANKGYSLIGNPFPTEIKLTDLVATNLVYC